MSLINGKKIKEFSTWAKENEDKEIYPRIDKDCSSYFIERKLHDTYMMEYSIYTIEELKEALGKYCGLFTDPEMLKRLTIEICQNKFVRKDADFSGITEEKSGDVDRNEGNAVRDFIYLF